MSYGKVWPVHPKPLPDELLSSWMVRLAQANGIKLQTLSWQLFGNARSPWNRDIDRSAPPWLIRELALHTGINYWEIFHTTLVTYRQRLYARRRWSGQLPWILPVNNYGMRHTAFGQQFCPVCLSNDPTPYFRKQWRLAPFTYCPIHHVKLVEACPSCGLAVMYYRGDFGRTIQEARPMHVCHGCGYNYAEMEGEQTEFFSEEIHQAFNGMLVSLSGPISQIGTFNLPFFLVLHQLCAILVSLGNKARLEEFICQRLGAPFVARPRRRLPIEGYSLTERHHLLQCGLWLMGDLAGRLGDAWAGKTIRYNYLLKGFDGAPREYRHLVRRFSDWRNP